MIVESLMASGLTTVGGLAGYLSFELGRNRLKPATSAPNLPDSRESILRDSLVGALKNPPPGGIRLADYATACQVSPASATRVAEELYGRFALKVADDGIIEPWERAKLDSLASVLDILPDRAEGIEGEANGAVYREVVAEVLSDGIVTPEEAAHLAGLRRSLGIDPMEAAKLFDPTQVKLDDSLTDGLTRPSPARHVTTGSAVGLGLALILMFVTRPAPAITPSPAETAQAPTVPANWVAEPSETPAAVAGPDAPQAGEGSSPTASAESTEGTSSTTRRSAASLPPVRPNPGPTVYQPPVSASPSYAPSSSYSGGGTVHVRGYTRKDGTYVAPHTRSAPGSGGRRR